MPWRRPLNLALDGWEWLAPGRYPLDGRLGGVCSVSERCGEKSLTRVGNQTPAIRRPPSSLFNVTTLLKEGEMPLARISSILCVTVRCIRIRHKCVRQLAWLVCDSRGHSRLPARETQGESALDRWRPSDNGPGNWCQSWFRGTAEPTQRLYTPPSDC
jgi:hypothetical protein